MTLIYSLLIHTLLVDLTPNYHSCIAIESNMPKKTRPITVRTAEESDALDEATFAELAEDEECLHQAL